MEIGKITQLTPPPEFKNLSDGGVFQPPIIVENQKIDLDAVFNINSKTVSFEKSKIDNDIIINIKIDDEIIMTIPNERLKEIVVSMQEYMKGGKDIGTFIDMFI